MLTKLQKILRSINSCIVNERAAAAVRFCWEPILSVQGGTGRVREVTKVIKAA